MILQKNEIRRNLFKINLFAIVSYLVLVHSYTKVTFIISSIMTNFLGISISQHDLSLNYSGYISIVCIFLQLLVTYIFYWKNKMVFQKLDLKKDLDWKLILLVLIVGLTFNYSAGIFANGYEVLMNQLGYTFYPAMSSKENVGQTVQMGMLLYAFVIGPLAEEFIYRETITHYLLNFSPLFAIVISSLMFSFMHATIDQIPSALIYGLLFGLIYCCTKKIYTTMIVHVLNNFISTISSLYFDNPGVQDSIEKFQAFGTLLLNFLILLIAFVMLYVLLQYLQKHYNLSWKFLLEGETGKKSSQKNISKKYCLSYYFITYALLISSYILFAIYLYDLYLTISVLNN
ncbi:CPBP family intramembrane glutamic endopeptidase [Atopobacter phocae]|uniref:CPBP family intramembrane glutamic endopeptidase n=1 Tax=Atopobacter phocae TaxID=136492 RepID=UPI0004726CD6|nr:type II CAAX endopeptidase family protein [Atopobacter phocae]